MKREDELLLLELARNTLETYFKDGDPDTSQCVNLTQLRGCFVTLYKHRDVRGFIGFPRPIMPLYEAIIAATKAAAFDDPKRDALDENELCDIVIEIAVITIPELIHAKSQDDYLSAIIPGKHGLIIEHAGYSGLLMPKTADDNHYVTVEFLQALCREAGLPEDDWKNANAKIFKFEADIFRET
jgi:AmmeMemoRadiSam system protein A